MRRIFIGDVQGCADELEELLEKLNFDPLSDRLHFVGDLLRRGPESLRVLRLVRELQGICVLGNHEAALLRKKFFTREASPAEEIPVELTELKQAEDLEVLGSWLLSLPLLYSSAEICLVHAAMPPALWHARTLREGQALLPAWEELRWHESEDMSFLFQTRYCDPTGSRPPADKPEPEPPYEPWFHFYEGPWTVVFGHWARKGLVLGERVRGLDTGCVYGRALSAWIAEEDRLVQVPARRRYWP